MITRGVNVEGVWRVDQYFLKNIRERGVCAVKMKSTPPHMCHPGDCLWNPFIHQLFSVPTSTTPYFPFFFAIHVHGIFICLPTPQRTSHDVPLFSHRKGKTNKQHFSRDNHLHFSVILFLLFFNFPRFFFCTNNSSNANVRSS